MSIFVNLLVITLGLVLVFGGLAACVIKMVVFGKMPCPCINEEIRNRISDACSVMNENTCGKGKCGIGKTAVGITAEEQRLSPDKIVSENHISAGRRVS